MGTNCCLHSVYALIMTHSFISASLEILYYVATRWDQFVLPAKLLLLLTIYICSCNDSSTFISASLEILCYVAIGWDQYVGLSSQNPEVLLFFNLILWGTSHISVPINVMITSFCTFHGIGILS